ncbi:MAG: peptidoglycan DD-metalloendopeptidase family protein [Patescibacteria group bacterium]
MEKSKRNSRKLAFGTIATLGMIFLLAGGEVLAQNNSEIIELQKKIEEKNKAVAELNKEINKYQTDLIEVSKSANTLQGAVKSLDLTRNKLLKDIKVTENEVESTTLNLSKLDIQIGENEKRIEKNSESLGETLRLINETSENSMVEIFLKYDDFGSAWEEVDTLSRFQTSVQQKVNDLKVTKEVLEDQKTETEEEKNELERLEAEYNSQHKIVEANKKQKEQLLKETRNTESEYKKILARNLARKAEVEREIFEFESRLQIFIDPSKIPSARSGVLAWPLDNISVSQFFGRTADSIRLYVSGTHNGVDFRAAVGTRVKAADSGVVSALGNTDEVRGCYSFGRWILIAHNNGLSTLYSHLSASQVSVVGQQVERGATIAFSGGAPGMFGAGYSTGPHLHFGAYITEGLRPQRYTSATPCNGAYMPLADQRAYLDPMAFLPSL